MHIRCSTEDTTATFPGKNDDHLEDEKTPLSSGFYNKKLSTFQAHESAIKCLAIDPHEEHFVTGSADGDIKVCVLLKRIGG